MEIFLLALQFKKQLQVGHRVFFIFSGVIFKRKNNLITCFARLAFQPIQKSGIWKYKHIFFLSLVSLFRFCLFVLWKIVSVCRQIFMLARNLLLTADVHDQHLKYLADRNTKGHLERQISSFPMSWLILYISMAGYCTTEHLQRKKKNKNTAICSSCPVFILELGTLKISEIQSL